MKPIDIVILSCLLTIFALMLWFSVANPIINETPEEATTLIETDILEESIESEAETEEIHIESEIETVPLETEAETEPEFETETAIEVETEIETELFIEEPEPVQTETRMMVDKDDEVSLIAAVVYQEMGGDYGCDDCRRRVADTILNRVASPYFPDTIYEVLTQEQLQYGFDSTTGVYWQERAKNPGEAHAVERAYRIAEEVLNGQHSEIYGKDYIWQAEFIQGVNNIYCCNTYFGQRDENKEW